MAMTKLSNILFKIFGVVILLSSFIGGWIMMDYKQFVANPLPLSGQGYHYIMPPGTSFKRFAEDLNQAGVVPHPLYFRWLALFEGKAHAVKAGEYLFTVGLTPPQLLDQVVSGAVVQHTLTIVEGWSFAQLLEALQQQGAIEHKLSGLSKAQIMERLNHPGQHPEGRFLPDTYHFPLGTTDIAFLQRTYQAMDARLAEEWGKRDQGLPYKAPYEALIMASIIEKETGLPEERPEIAGVFIRRLARGMRLQTDPTVIYALGERFDGNLRRQDLSFDSPYNTYMHIGLPPTPIALPGLASIHAALHPAPGQAIYFVARGDGRHEFSATLAAHNKAVQRYQIDNHRPPAGHAKK